MNREVSLCISFKELQLLGLTTTLLLLIAVISKIKLSRPVTTACNSLLIILSLLTLTLGLIDTAYYAIFSFNFSISAFETFLGTNSSETVEFLKQYFSFKVLTISIIYITIFIFIIKYRHELVRYFQKPAIIAILTIYSIFNFIQAIALKKEGRTYFDNLKYTDIIVKGHTQYKNNLEIILNNKNNLRCKEDTLKSVLSRNISSEKELVVLILSESTSKSHMSSYGYNRKTTPNLDTISDLIKFNDVTAPASLTTDAIPKILISESNSGKHLSVPQLFNSIGFSTHWLSNQASWGNIENLIAAIASMFNKRTYTEKFMDLNTSDNGRHYDEQLLPHLQTYLDTSNATKKFLVIHLIGSHFDYNKRYPPKFSVFKGNTTTSKYQNANEQINFYDNSIYYQDSVVGEIYRKVKQYSNNKNYATVLYYFPDHAEELFEEKNFNGHTYPPSRYTAEIPFFLWWSPTYEKNNTAICNNVKLNKDKKVTTKDFTHSLFSVLSITDRSNQFYDSTKSISSSYYKSNENRMVYEFKYEDLVKQSFRKSSNK